MIGLPGFDFPLYLREAAATSATSAPSTGRSRRGLLHRRRRLVRAQRRGTFFRTSLWLSLAAAANTAHISLLLRKAPSLSRTIRLQSTRASGAGVAGLAAVASAAAAGASAGGAAAGAAAGLPRLSAALSPEFDGGGTRVPGFDLCHIAFILSVFRGVTWLRRNQMF